MKGDHFITYLVANSMKLLYLNALAASIDNIILNDLKKNIEQYCDGYEEIISANKILANKT